MLLGEENRQRRQREQRRKPSQSRCEDHRHHRHHYRLSHPMTTTIGVQRKLGLSNSAVLPKHRHGAATRGRAQWRQQLLLMQVRARLRVVVEVIGKHLERSTVVADEIERAEEGTEDNKSTGRLQVELKM